MYLQHLSYILLSLHLMYLYGTKLQQHSTGQHAEKDPKYYPPLTDTDK